MKNIYNFFGVGGDGFFSGTISRKRVEKPSNKIVINLPWTVKNWLARSKATDSQTDRHLVTFK